MPNNCPPQQSPALAIDASSARPKPQRESGLELMRIILMLLIIAHHYVVNSGVTSLIDLHNPTPNAVFLVLWGMWGKTAINAFVLITGYFMCTKRLTWQKVFKLWLQIKFYRIAIALILAAFGLYALSGGEIFRMLFSNLVTAGNNFPASFVLFYIFIPILNIIIYKLDRQQFRNLILLLVFTFTVTMTFFLNGQIFNEVFWYMTLYFIAAYIRLYPKPWMSNRRVTTRLFIGSIAMAYLTVIAILAALQIDAFSEQLSKYYSSVTFCYYFISDSGKLLALVVGVSCFLFFKNLNLGYVPFINKAASAAFGVLLIHAHSSSMRSLLWGHIVNVPGMYYAPLPLLILQAILVPFAIYAICAAIDLLRIRFLERPLFSFLQNHSNKLEKAASVVKLYCNKIVGKIL